MAQDRATSRGLGSMLSKRLGLEVASGMVVGVTLRGRAISTRALRRLPTMAAPALIPVKALLGGPRVGAPPVHLVTCEPEHVHRTLLVPPMTAPEQAEVVRREIAREAGSDRVSAWRRMRSVEVDGVRKDELLIVAASPDRLQRVLNAVVVGGGTPRLVVTGPLALVAAAQALSPTPLDRPTVLVHWGVSTLTIVILSEGALKFARVIEPPASDLDPLDWIPVEIDRSLRHYAVLSKGERVEQVMVSVAEAAPASRLFAGSELAARLHLPVTNLNALLAPELPERADVDTDLAGVEMVEGAFTLAYGAALLTPHLVPNLLPHALTVQRRSRRVIGVAIAASVLLVVGLASKSALMAQDIQARRARVAQAQASRQALQARIQEQGRIEAERQRMRETARLLTEDPLKRVPLDDVLREIARLAPAQLRLDQLTVSTDASGQTFKVAGLVQEADLVDAQNAVNEFYYGLRASPLVYDVQVQENQTAPAPAATSADRTEADETPSLPFVLTLKPKDLN